MSQQEKWYIEKYIQLLYEIEQGLDDEECEDRWEEAIRRANTKHQKYSPSTRLKPKIRRKKRVH